MVDIPTNAQDNKKPLRPCNEAIERILWDKSLNINDFTFIYSDRYYNIYT